MDAVCTPTLQSVMRAKAGMAHANSSKVNVRAAPRKCSAPPMKARRFEERKTVTVEWPDAARARERRVSMADSTWSILVCSKNCPASATTPDQGGLALLHRKHVAREGTSAVCRTDSRFRSISRASRRRHASKPSPKCLATVSRPRETIRQHNLPGHAAKETTFRQQLCPPREHDRLTAGGPE